MREYKSLSKDFKKENKGITLIALIITIIVLIILAGITLSVLVGENGIINKAIEAKNKTEISTEKEQIQIAYMELLSYYDYSEITSIKLKEKLEMNKVKVNIVYGNDKIGYEIILQNKNVYEISNNDNVQYIGNMISKTETETVPLMMEQDENYAFWNEEYRKNIETIKTKPYIVGIENAVEKWDVSDKKDMSVMAYLVKNENNMYDLYLMSNGYIKLKSARYFFQTFDNLKECDLNYFDTSSVTDMSAMFNDCKKLEKLDLNSFNTSNVTSMNLMFNHCQKLTQLNLTSFDTSEVKQMGFVFNGCGSLMELDLKNFNTTNVTTMTYMFTGCALSELDLSSFDTSKLTNTSLMFYGCRNLKTIYVGEKWDNGSITSSKEMFKDCISLKGKISFSAEKIDINFANYQNGYFTLKNI